MWSRTESHLLNLPADQVMDLISDPERLPEWHHWFAQVTRTSQHHGRYQPQHWSGTMHHRTAGEFTFTLGDNSVLLRQPQPALGEHEFSWTITEEPGGCRLNQRVRVGGRAAQFFTEAAGRPSARDFALDAVRLHRLLGAPKRPDRIKAVIAGGGGFLAGRLAADLVTRGHEVVVLSRRPDKTLPFRQVRWDGRGLGVWAEELGGERVAVINLPSGRADHRPGKRGAEVREAAQVDATRPLVAASQGHRLTHWIQGSTTGLWGNTGDTHLTEDSPLPEGKAAADTEILRAGEEEAAGAVAQHRLLLRSATVLAQDGPKFDRLTAMARAGAGGRIGSGRQWFSWIHLEDWLAVIRCALGLEQVTLPDGVVVAAAPFPARNAELMKLLRQDLAPGGVGLPTPGPLPRIGGRAQKGPGSPLAGNHATSRVLEEAGFEFQHPRLAEAIADLLA